MGSSEIRASLRAKRTELEGCEAVIEGLAEDIESLEAVYNTFVAQKTHFEEYFEDRRQRLAAMEHHQRFLLNQGFTGAVDRRLGSQALADKRAELEQAVESIQTLWEAQGDTLDEESERKKRLEKEIAELEASLARALARERDAAQAAAAALLK